MIFSVFLFIYEATTGDMEPSFQSTDWWKALAKSWAETEFTDKYRICECV